MLESLNLDQVKVIVGMRGSAPLAALARKPHLIVPLPQVIGLSQARNMLLDRYQPPLRSIIVFLDDDATLTEMACQILQTQWDRTEFMIGRFSFQKPNAKTIHTKIDENQIDLGMSVANSSTIFCLGSCLIDFQFDEELGLGAKYQSGEDLDLLFFLLSNRFHGIYDENLVIDHPQKDHLSQYFPGSIAVLQKYSKLFPHIRVRILRRFVHGVYLFLQGKLKLKDFSLSIAALKKKPLEKNLYRDKTIFDHQAKPLEHRPVLVTWVNHYSILQIIDAKVPLTEFDYIGIDGIFLKRILGSKQKRTSADLSLATLLADNSSRVVLIGGLPNNVLPLKSRMKTLFPNVILKLQLDGYGDIQQDHWLAKVFDTEPTIIVVGLGPVLQEKTALEIRHEAMKRNYSCCIVTCGGWLDQLLIPRYYPAYAYRLRINWLVRLFREPKRLWKRYSWKALEALLRKRLISATLRNARGYQATEFLGVSLTEILRETTSKMT